MGTARELITRSFKLLGVLGHAENPSAGEASDALVSYLDMMDAWSADGKKVHFITKDEHTLVAGTASYTMGATGDIAVARPSRIITASLKVGSVEYPMKLIGAEMWAKLHLKTTQSDIPTMLYAEGTFPNETLNLFYTPGAANTLVLYSEKPFTTATLDTELSFPPAYLKAMRYGLAIELAPEYGVQISGDIYEGYRSAMAMLSRKNAQDTLMDANQVTGGRSYNILTGGYE